MCDLNDFENYKQWLVDQEHGALLGMGPMTELLKITWSAGTSSTVGKLLHQQALVICKAMFTLGNLMIIDDDVANFVFLAMPKLLVLLEDCSLVVIWKSHEEALAKTNFIVQKEGTLLNVVIPRRTTLTVEQMRSLDMLLLGILPSLVESKMLMPISESDVTTPSKRSEETICKSSSPLMMSAGSGSPEKVEAERQGSFYNPFLMPTSNPGTNGGMVIKKRKKSSATMLTSSTLSSGGNLSTGLTSPLLSRKSRVVAKKLDRKNL